MSETWSPAGLCTPLGPGVLEKGEKEMSGNEADSPSQAWRYTAMICSLAAVREGEAAYQLAGLLGSVHAEDVPGGGEIVCWHDKSLLTRSRKTGALKNEGEKERTFIFEMGPL